VTTRGLAARRGSLDSTSWMCLRSPLTFNLSANETDRQPVAGCTVLFTPIGRVAPLRTQQMNEETDNDGSYPSEEEEEEPDEDEATQRVIEQSLLEYRKLKGLNPRSVSEIVCYPLLLKWYKNVIITIVSNINYIIKIVSLKYF